MSPDTLDHRPTDTGNTFRPFDGDTDQYNFGPINHYQRPDTRYSLGAMGHYELAEYADVYTQLMFSDYESIAQIAPGGEFFGEQQSRSIATTRCCRRSSWHTIGCARRD